MVEKTLESLTFDYLRAYDELHTTADTYNLVPTVTNRMAKNEAEWRFMDTANSLSAAIEPMELAEYFKGFQKLVESSLNFLDPQRAATLPKRGK